MTEPRGLRNRNPGNIVVSSWTTRQSGYSGPEPEGRFATFATMAHGLAALMRLLLVYRREHGLDTVRGIIDRWAPPAENDTGAYVQHVASLLMVSPDTSLPDAPDTYVALAKAIAIHENGPAAAQLAREDFALARSLVWPETQGPPVAVPERAPDASPAPAPAPIEDRSTIDPESRLERPMLPALTWTWTAIRSLMPAVPELVRLFGGGSEVSERNAKAVEAVGGVIRQVAGADTDQAAAARIAADPALIAQLRTSLIDQWSALWGMLKEAEELEQAGMDRAVARVERALPVSEQRLWTFAAVGAGQFVLTLAVMIGLGFMIWPVVQASAAGKEISDLPGWVMLIIGQLLLAIALEWRSILQFVVGTSQGSSAKNALIGKLSEK